MTTFYLLPPRPLLDDAFARFRDAWLPGLPGPRPAWPAFAELLDRALAGRADVCAVFRDELVSGEALDVGLRDRFGAEAGDRVVEVRVGPTAGEVRARQWLLEDPAGSVPAPLVARAGEYNHG